MGNPFVSPQRFVTNNNQFAPPTAGGAVALMYAPFTFADTALRTLFTLPAGAVPVDWWIDVLTDFNAGTNNNLDIGTTGDGDYFAAALAIGTQGIFRAGATNTVFGRLGIQFTVPTGISITYAPTGTTVTTGAAKLFVSYILRAF